MMTENEILTHVYKKAIISPIQALSGQVYKKTRPTDSKAVDCIISLISGITGKQLQNGSIQVKIFYPKIEINNTYVEDTVTGQALEKILYDFSNVLIADTVISFDEDSREIYSVEVQESKEYFVIMKMNYLI